MEIDRVPPMGGVMRQPTQVWPDAIKRRRRFVEELSDAEPDTESDDEAPENEAADSEELALSERASESVNLPEGAEDRPSSALDVLA